jgi:X-Pro dipeptidyl-peptidase C-terminal non-catalytic domain/Prolyl oligopeptidase family
MATLKVCVGCALALLLFGPVGPARADLQSLEAACSARDAADGTTSNGVALPFVFCDDGVPATGGTNPNPGAVKALPVPQRYAGYAGLPPKASPDPNSGADANGDVALDADLSLPDPALNPRPARGYPLMVMMHTCCGSDKTNFEAATVDGSGETWHYSNAWFAARGYVVLNYTARGFVNSSNQGSTGESQIDSRLYEVNDFQHLACQLAADPSLGIDPRKVVVTGSSYGAGLSWLALTDPTWSCGAIGHPEIQMRLAASAPKYGWSDLLYSFVPNGSHLRDRLPPTDPQHASTRDPFGFPRESILTALYVTGKFGSPPSGSHLTFTAEMDRAVACLGSTDPFEQNPLCTDVLGPLMDEFLTDRSAYYQNDFFAGLRAGTVAPVPLFSAGSMTSPLFSQVEHGMMTERLRSVVPSYPVQEYYGPIGDFTQNKSKEWGDLCGEDHHVCTFSDYPNGDLSADPPTRVRLGITTRLNRFVDYFATPSGDPRPARPSLNVTAALQVCQSNASNAFPADEPGERITAPRFGELARGSLRLEAAGVQTTVNAVTPNPHAASADPIANFAANGGNCPVDSTPAGAGVAVYDFPTLAQDLTLIGRTRVTVPHTGAGNGIQLNARLYEVLPSGQQVLVDRGGTRETQPNTTTTFDLNGNAWRFRTGDKLRIELAQDDAPYVKRSTQPSSLTLAGVTLQLPIR